MELRHLRYFCAVADSLSFTQAARRLHVSQSGVSGQVRALEQEIGVTLLRRNAREVALTPEGAIFAQEARDILQRADRAIEMTVRASQGKLGKLAIGLCGPATAPFLPRLIREFRKRHPDLLIALREIDPAKQPQALVDGEIDLGFTRALRPQFRRTLSSEVLFREPVAAVLPKAHPLAQQASIRLADLAGERFILYSRERAPDLFDTLVGLCRRAKFSANIIDSPNLWQSVLTLVEAGEGVALVPACLQHYRSDGIAFRTLSDRGSTLDVILAWRRQESNAVRDHFLELLRARRGDIEALVLRSPANARP